MEVSGRGRAYCGNLDTGIPCDPCLIDNALENGQFYCTTCDEFLCDTCARNHRKSKASRNHQLLDGDEMPKQKESNVEDKFCDKHDGRLIEYFCEKHKTCCCSVCVTLDHIQCNVNNIDDLAKGFSTSLEYKALIKQIEDIEKQLAEYKNQTQNDYIDVTNCVRQFKADMQLFRSEINAKIDSFEHELMQQAEQIKNDDLIAIESANKLYDTLQADLSEILSTRGWLAKCRNNQQLYISAKKARTQVKEYTDKPRIMSQENIVRRYAFLRNDNILNTLNSQRKLGSLEIGNEVQKGTTTIEKQTEKCLIMPPTAQFVKEKDAQTQVKEKQLKMSQVNIARRYTMLRNDDILNTFKPPKAKFVKDINMKHNKDNFECVITGSVLMSSDLLAVVDRYNNSVKVVDLRSDTITCYIKLDDKPWDITCMNPETLVVTSDTNLVFLLYDGKLSVEKQIPMKSGYKGITYKKGKLFVTFSGDQPSVKILNDEGKVLQTFQRNDEGHNLFSIPLYITVNRCGDTMYVSDRDQNTVTSLSMDGKVCNTYKHESLRAPIGLTDGDDDSIYAVGCKSNSIHQITPKCKPVCIALDLTKEVTHPLTVLSNNTDKTLYVNSSTLSGDMLSVYKLE